MRNRTRRNFLKTTAATGSLLILSPEEVFGVLVGSTYVRQNVNTLGPNSPDIVAYKKGINAMKALASTNPLNWEAWANIHGIGPSPPSGTNPVWNTCQHGSWWFLPWHRMYLYYFERIIRKLSNTNTFSLPYWDYTAGNVSGNTYLARALPQIFRSPTTNNALYIPQRNASINAGGQMTTSAVSSTTAMNTVNFTGPAGTATSFGSQQLNAPNHGASPHGRLESSPHDSVHGSIGGYMGSFGTAARDPIFWLHHCNIDRLWNVWLTMGGGRSDPKNSTWCNQTFQFFNENGTQVGIRVRDVINALAQLKYRYPGVAEVTQSCPTIVTPMPEAAFDLTARTIRRIDQPITIRSQALRMRVPLAGQARQRSQEVASAPGQNLVLRIEGIKVDRQPGIVYEVYVGLPDGVRPDPNSRYFVGVLSTFGAEHAGAEGMTAAFPIDAAAAAALQANTNDVPVIIAPRGVVLNGQERLEVQGNVTFTSVRVLEE